jgi:hypothetical protein
MDSQSVFSMASSPGGKNSKETETGRERDMEFLMTVI